MATGVTSSITSDVIFSSARYQLTDDDDTLIISGATVTMAKPQGDVFTGPGNDTALIEDSTIFTDQPNLTFFLGSGDDTLTVRNSTLSAPVLTGSGNDLIVIDGTQQNKVRLNKEMNFGAGDDILELVSILENAASIDFGSSGAKTLRFNGGAHIPVQLSGSTYGTMGVFTHLDVTIAGGTTGCNLKLAGEQTSITLNGNLLGTTNSKGIYISDGVTTLTVDNNVRTNVGLVLNNVQLIHLDGAVLEFSDYTGYAVTANESVVGLHDIVVKGGRGLTGSNTAWTIENSDFSNSTNGINLTGGTLVFRSGGLANFSEVAMILSGTTLTGSKLSFMNNPKFGAIVTNNADVTITDFRANNNSACSTYSSGGSTVYHHAGGVILQNGGSMTLSSASFSGNFATSKGGAICQNGGVMTLDGATFSGNIVTSSYASNRFGGAICCQSGGYATISGAVFSGNVVSGFLVYGGAVYLDNAIANMENTVFAGNYASAEGGAVSGYAGGGAVYMNKSTLNYFVTSGAKVSNVGNSVGAYRWYGGGWLYAGNQSTVNISVDGDSLLTIGDSTGKDSIAGDSTCRITKNGTGRMVTNSDISGYQGLWTVTEGTLELARIARTIKLDDWTIGTDATLLLSVNNDTINMNMSKKIGTIDMGGGADTINTNHYDLTDGTILLNDLTLGGGGRISVKLRNRSTTEGSTLRLNDIYLDSDFTGNDYKDTILINQESTLNGAIDLGGGNNVITAQALSTFKNTLKMGAGDDVLTFTAATFDGTLDFGGGNNTLTTTGDGKFADITGGNGGNIITVGGDGTFSGEIGLGDGDDSITIGGDAIFSSKVCLGGGNDVITMDGNGTFAGEIDLGTGANAINVNQSLTANSIKITEGGETSVYVDLYGSVTNNTLTVYSDETAARDSITLSWAEQTDLDKVRILVSRDSSFQSYEFNLELYNKSKSFTLNLQQGYFIQFQAQDEDGWRQRLLDDHVAPNQVTGVSFNGSVLSWDETHDDLCGNGVKQYHVEVATDAAFTNVIAHEIVTGKRYAPATLAEETLYFRVNAEDYTNNIGEWSETVTGMFDNTPPSRPIGGKSAVEGYSADLSWTAASDTGSGVAQYEYRIATDSDYGEIVISGTTEACSVTIGNLKYGTYYWQVKAIDAAGNTGDWSLSKSFSTVDTVAPGTPSNLDFGIEGGSTLSVIWDPAADDALGSGLNRYRVQLASDAEFVTIVEDQPSTVPEITIGDLAKGDYYLRVCAVDNAGNMSAWTAAETFTIDTDTTPPTISDIQASTTEPTNQDVIVTATFTDNVEVASAQYRIGESGMWKEYKNGVTVTENATVYFKAVDTSGNTSAEVPFAVSNIDKTPPEKPAAEADVTTPTNKTVTVTATFTDDSAVREYSTDGQETWAEYTAPIAFDTNGTVYFRAADAVGNVSEAAVFTVSNIDLIPPEKPVASADITAPTNRNVTVTATFSDDSYTKEYSLDGKAWMTYSEGVTMEDNGTVYFRGADEAGNVSEVTDFLVGNIDRTAPEKPAASANITAPTRQNVMVTASFTDDSVVREYSMDGEDWRAYTKPIWFAENGSVSFRAADEAGNVSEKTVFVVDNIISSPLEAPVLSVDVTAPTSSTVMVSATFSDLASVKQYSVDGQTWLDYNGPLTFTDNGFVVFLCLDASGECAYTAYAVTNIDKVAPEQPGAYATATAPTNRDVTVKAMFSNDTAVKEFSLDGEDWQLYTDGIVFEDNGTVYFRGTDAAGNVSKTTTYEVTNIDKVAPEKPTVSADVTEITSGPVTVSAAFSQDSVVREYSLDGENWSDYTGSIEFRENGMSFFRGTDEAGNISLVANYAVAVIDSVAPTVSGITPSTTAPAQSVTITAEFKDDVALESSLYKLGVNGEWTDYPAGGVVVTENTTVYFKAVDMAGNESEVASYDVTNIASVTPTFVTKSDVDGNGISDVMFVWTGYNYAHGYWMNGDANDWRSTYAVHPAEWENLGCYDMNGNGKADSVLVGNIELQTGKGAYMGYYLDAVDADANWANIDFLNNPTDVVWKNKVCNLTGNENANSIIWYAPDMYTLGAWTDGTAEWALLSGNFGGEGWTMAGCGDFDGDGKASVLMSGGNGQMFYSVGIDGVATSHGSANWSGWEVRAIGDFAGDGREDIVLFNNTLGTIVMCADGNVDDFVSLGNLNATDWFVVGAGDYNGDQKDDLLVRQYSTGMLGYYDAADVANGWVEMGRGVDLNWTVIA